MGEMLRGGLDACFVLLTGDNFYKCKSKSDFAAHFEVLRREMLDAVPLPWYAVLGNHDVKYGGAEMHTGAFHGAAGPAGWSFRCPSTFYCISEDWARLSSDTAASDTGQPVRPWCSSLLEIAVLNTNKTKSTANFFGAAEGQLEGSDASWDDQKAWLRDSLSETTATWKVVCGHHPIELIPQGILEHGLPGVRFLTAGFMKGHATSKMRQKGLRDVVVAGGAHVYLCGHQHLMAHLKRKPEQPKWTGKTGPADGALDYAIFGSSSKLEQDLEDWDAQPAAEASLSGWQSWQVDGMSEKMSELWFAQKIGFAVIDATPCSLTVRYYSVNSGDGEAQGASSGAAVSTHVSCEPIGGSVLPHGVALVHEFVKRRD